MKPTCIARHRWVEHAVGSGTGHAHRRSGFGWKFRTRNPIAECPASYFDGATEPDILYMRPFCQKAKSLSERFAMQDGQGDDDSALTLVHIHAARRTMVSGPARGQAAQA